MASVVVPAARLRVLRDVPLRRAGRYVLYWMTSQRRLRENFALDRALELVRETGKPLLIFEALRCGYEHASARLHRFVLDGMTEHEQTCAVRYLPYVEPEPGAGQGLLAALAALACVVVTDDAPFFHTPRMLAAAAQQCDARLEAVDSCGLLPLGDVEKFHTTAYAFRRHLQKRLPELLEVRPSPNPLGGRHERLATIPRAVLQRWPTARLAHPEQLLAELPIDQTVRPVDLRGGSKAGRSRLTRFVRTALGTYADDGRHPDANATSGLSPYLHFGHVGVHEVFRQVASSEKWTSDHLATQARGARAGWWGMSPGAEAFLDQVITWRELALHTCHMLPTAYASLSSLPAWAQATLAKHASDPREVCYRLNTFETAATHDEVWNAAQRELVATGAMHGYLRMLWGKKILEWTRTPDEALAVMIHLNDKYALDGRDPNSYAGMLWCLGRNDRPWAPERPVYGTVRYMSSKNTLRKLKMRAYLKRWAPSA
ncbi:MAG: deoxyribodipyrimidine photolyase [Planctomycetota bacterium]|nr:deoxyribodipyrimidine photolyase [Planctomycetota bacterium]